MDQSAGAVTTTATIRLDPAFTVGPVNRRLFGTFVEHMGRCVHTGIHQPDHPTADEHGFRRDVAALVDELGPTLVRYPGGNFVSGYRWEDGIGPKEQRPRVIDLAWNSIESNQVGTDDFLQWCERRGLEPMMAVNLGTRGLAEAVELLQYCTAQPGTVHADRRVANGRREPYRVPMWCLGNEMDGPWQLGHLTAREYGRKAAEVARAFTRYDSTLELVACGSSHRSMPTFGTWERVVLEECFDLVDHLSAHAYYEVHDGDEQSFLCAAEDMDRFIDAVVATADHVAAVRGSDKVITVSFDEWNVWTQADFPGEATLALREAPELIEDTYDVTDAVVVGSLLITLLRHTDRVAVACQAQLVNVIAPIRTSVDGGAWRQTIFHPFALTARHATGTVLAPAVTSPMITTGAYGEVSQVWCTATRAEDGSLAIFLVNRSLADGCRVRLEVDRCGPLEVVEHLVVHDADRAACNTEDAPDRVVPEPGDARRDDREVVLTLPAVSWHLVRLAPTPADT